MATTRERLHQMIDELPAEQFDAAAHAIYLLTIPEVNEPLTDEEMASIHEGREAYARGESIPHDEAMRRIGLR